MCAECNAKSAWKDPWQSCYFTCSTITNVKFPREITKNRITGFWSGVAGNYLHFGQNFLHKSNEKCRRLYSGKFDLKLGELLPLSLYLFSFKVWKIFGMEFPLWKHRVKQPLLAHCKKPCPRILFLQFHYGPTLTWGHFYEFIHHFSE